MSRFLGLDVGTRRIGVALSDPTGTVATPLETFLHRSLRHDLDHIADLARAHAISCIVVGWPRNMDGSVGPAARRTERFAADLRRRLRLPVDLWDERLSTAAAEQALLQADVRRDRRRALRDRIAAAVILQAYLDDRRRGLAARPRGYNDLRDKTRDQTDTL